LFSPADVVIHAVSPNLVKARVITLLAWMLPLLLASGVAALAHSPWWLIMFGSFAALTAWGCWLARRQAKAIGYAERDEDLLIRKGIMWRSLVVVPYGRMQFVDVTAGPLDRALGIAKVQLHTASASTDANIPGLVPAEAERLRDRLTARGEARLAGL